MSYKKVKIGDFLKRIKRPVCIVPDRDYKLVTIRINHKGVLLREIKKGIDIKSNMYEVKEGDFILSGIDARNGAFGIIPKELDGAIVTNDFWYFDVDNSKMDKHFFLTLTSTSWFDEICKRGSDGTTQRVRLQKNKFFEQEILLPSINAQIELAKRVNNIRNKQSLLITEITLQKEYVAKLKQSILQDAISGKLTAEWRTNNPNIEPASELLKRIKKEKQQLIKDGKIRKEKPLAPIVEDEIPFEIPSTWQWCRLGSILLHSEGGKSPNCLKQRVSSGQNGVITTTAIQVMQFVESENKILPTNYPISDKHRVKQGDVLITRAGPLNRTGVVCYVDKISHTLILSDKTIRLAFDEAYVSGKYITIALNNEKIKDTIRNKMTGMANSQVNISQDNMKLYQVPLPPYEEQIKIVDKVQHLLTYFTGLEQYIDSLENNAVQLSKTILAENLKTK